MADAENQLQAVRHALATAVLHNVAHLDSAEVLFGQPSQARQASRRKFPDVTPYEGVSTRHRGMVGHRHDSFELGTVTAGCCDVMIGDMLYEAQAGDWLIVRSRVFHAECPLPEAQPYATFWFSPGPLPRRSLQMCLHEFRGEAGYRTCRAEAARDMPSAERANLSRLMCKPWNSVIEAQGFMVQVIDWCLQHLVSSGPGRFRHGSPHVQSAQRIFWQSGLRLSVGEVAAELGLSPNYLSYLFRRDTGMTIRTFLHESRIDEACRLLTNKPWSIKRIAAHLGYSDAANFSSAFRQAKGVPPSRYRRQQQSRLAE